MAPAALTPALAAAPSAATGHADDPLLQPHRDALAALLAERVGGAGGDPFEQDEVVVPSAAIRRHLTVQLARAHGVCAGVRYSYLARWLWEQVARVVPGVLAESPFEAAGLTWRVYAALGEPQWVQRHRRLGAYLERADAVMRFELAAVVAGLFDQYVTFRPDWLSAWSRGASADLAGEGAPGASAREDEAWQAELWRRIVAELRLAPRQLVR